MKKPIILFVRGEQLYAGMEPEITELMIAAHIDETN